MTGKGEHCIVGLWHETYFLVRRAYDRNLLHEGPTRTQGQQPYHPRAPHGRTSRASHAWEYRPRGTRRPPPDYMYGARAPGGNPDLHYSGYRHPMHHDVLSGTRRRAEEDARQMDKVRNEMPFIRVIQISSMLLLAGFVFSGW